MRYFQRKLILFAATFTFAVVYAPLRPFPFGMDVALCACVTVLIFGSAIRRRGIGLFSGDEAKPITEILLIHALSLAALVIIARMGLYLTPFLPDWLSTPVGSDSYGRVGPTGFQMIQSVALFFLGFVELRVLTAKKTKASGEAAEKKKTLWSKPDLEAERMSGLRLR
jgi:hypothetical protein